MKTIIIIIVFCVSNFSFIYSQEIIKNTNSVLKKNKVSSITLSEFTYKNIKKKITNEIGRIIQKELYDSLGRNVETIYYDSVGKVDIRIKYYYADTIGHTMYRIEKYNCKDSLIELNIAEQKNEQTMYLFEDKGGLPCFRKYKFVYNDKELIQEAISYCPKHGIIANDDMIPCYTTKLEYTYRK